MNFLRKQLGGQDTKATYLDILREYNIFSENFTFITKALQFINLNMESAYEIMKSNKYSGKYSYYYDYISAMLGRNTTILKMAMSSTYPTNIVAPNAVIYNYNTLYDTNGNIIISSDMYKYISDRYIGINYNSLSNQFMAAYNKATGDIDINPLLKQLQEYNVRFIVDSIQMSNYSNTITNDPNIATPNRFIRYITDYKLEALYKDEDNNAEKAQMIQNITYTYETIKVAAEEVMTKVESILRYIEVDTHTFNNNDLSKIITTSGILRNYYIKADYIVNTNYEYFQRIQNSNGEDADALSIYNLNTLTVVGVYMSNDYKILKDMLSSSNLKNTSNQYDVAKEYTMSNVVSNIVTTLSNFSNIYSNTLDHANSDILTINKCISQLQTVRLDRPCFEYYQNILNTSNQIDTIIKSSLPVLSTQVSMYENTYVKIDTIQNLQILLVSLSSTYSSLSNLYIEVSDISENIQISTDEIIETFNTNFNNIPLDVVFKLPEFSGSNCPLIPKGKDDEEPD